MEDRYSATGTPYPTEASCDTCDGMGLHPLSADQANQYAVEMGGRITIIGQTEEDGSACPDDGWLFIECPACKGTRLKLEDTK